MDFIHVLSMLVLDILVSFCVVLLFTKVPTGQALCLLTCHFHENILRFFHHDLTPSFFSINDQFYEQPDGVTMGLLLSPVIANFFMKYSKEMAL
jgi:hypothetical protein